MESEDPEEVSLRDDEMVGSKQSKKANICVPGINTETLNNLALNEEMTFRDGGTFGSSTQRQMLSLEKTQDNLEVTFEDRKAFKRRTISLDPTRQDTVHKKFMEH